MATAYKYVERAADSQVNWAEVGKNLTDTLKEENRIREETKGAIDAQARDYYKITNEVPQGENTELNKFALTGAADLQEQMLLQNTLLKSGQLSPRQYTIMMQNLTDGTDQAFSLFENYNAEYERKMAMNNSNLPVGEQASEIQNWTMESLEGFGNFNESKLVIDPQTGIMSMAKMSDGSIQTLETVQTLENRIKGTYTKFDVMAAAETFEEAAGVDKRVIQELGNKYKAGVFQSISDITQKTEGGYNNMTDAERQEAADKIGVSPDDLKSISLFQEAQSNYVRSKLDIGTTSGASVLLDFVNINPETQKPYRILSSNTENKLLAKADSDIIIMENVNGRMVPDLSDKQREVAERALTTQINYGLDYEEVVNVQQVYKEPRPKTYAPRDVREENRGIEELDSKISKIADLYNGDNTQLKGSTNYFRDQEGVIQEVSRNKDGIVVTYTNEAGEKESRDISFYVMEANPAYDNTKEDSETNRKEIRAKREATQADVDSGLATAVGEMIDQRLSQEEFIESAGPLLTGEDDVSKALERGGYNTDRPFNVDGESTSSVTSYKEEEVPLMDYTVESTNFVKKQLKEAGVTLKGGISNEAGDDVYVAEQLNSLYAKDYGLSAIPIDATDNEVKISVPGFESVIIDTNNYTDESRSGEMDKLEGLILSMIKKNEGQLAKENNWKGEEKRDRFGVILKKPKK